MKYFSTLILCLVCTFSIYAQNNEDCINSVVICDNGPIDFNPMGIGYDDFYDNPNNFAGCLQSDEENSAWYTFTINQSAPDDLELGFIIDPDGGNYEDYDFAVWGPQLSCDSLGEPIRCSYAGSGCDFCPQTGLGMGALDFSEDPFGDGFVANLIVNPGETYILMVDNFSGSSQGFSLEWTGEGAEYLSCDVGCIIAVDLDQTAVTLCSGGDSLLVDLTITGDVEDPIVSWSGDNLDFLDDSTIEDPTITIPEDFVGVLEYQVLVSDSLEECSAWIGIQIVVNLCVDETEIVHFDFDDCDGSSGETAIYNEFVPSILTQTECGDVAASAIFRENPESNRHSCTPGMDNTAAMCVSALDDCDFESDSEKAIRFSVFVVPNENVTMTLENLSFLEKAPLMFDWINGNSGANDPPTNYGVRILVNGVEAFLSLANATTDDWTLESFDLGAIPAFNVTEETTFDIELLGYCLVGNGADVQAWDVENVSVSFSCMSDEGLLSEVEGGLSTFQKAPISDAHVLLHSQNNDVSIQQSGDRGEFSFSGINSTEDHTLSVHKNDDTDKGISTLDMVYILKHLLDQQRFTSVQQFIAADVNNNGDISAADMVEIRKVLLGSQETFTNNDSWKFISNAPHISVPNWTDHKTHMTIDSEVEACNPKFIGVKIGDVNMSADMNQFLESEDRDDKKTMWNIIEDANRSGVFLFKAAKEIQLSGFQFSAMWEGLNVTDLQSEKIDISMASLSQEKELRISWASNESTEFKVGDVIFELTTDGLSLGSLQLTESLLAEAYNQYLEVLDLEIRTDIASEPIANSVLLFPNPFENQFQINVRLEHDMPIKLFIHNALGHVVYSSETSSANSHELVISKNELDNSVGVFYYKVLAGEEEFVGKMIGIE